MVCVLGAMEKSSIQKGPPRKGRCFNRNNDLKRPSEIMHAVPKLEKQKKAASDGKNY